MHPDTQRLVDEIGVYGQLLDSARLDFERANTEAERLGALLAEERAKAWTTAKLKRERSLLN